MASISFASESLMDPRIQVKLDKYQKCGNIISQTSLLSSYTGSEPTTSATPPSTTPDINATNCATESSPKKDVQEALILMTTDAVHVHVVLVSFHIRFNKLVEISFNKFHMK